MYMILKKSACFYFENIKNNSKTQTSQINLLFASKPVDANQMDLCYSVLPY